MQSVDIPGAMQTALAERTDIVHAAQEHRISQLNLEVTRDQTKPQLDLTGGYSVDRPGRHRSSTRAS